MSSSSLFALSAVQRVAEYDHVQATKDMEGLATSEVGLMFVSSSQQVGCVLHWLIARLEMDGVLTTGSLAGV
jgi:hypothetical protein